MPDLGKYAAEVLAAYGVSVTLLVLIIGISWRRAVVVRRALEQAENG